MTRNDAIDHFSGMYQGVADTITGLYEIAGRPDLADRVRPTTRRRAGVPEDTDPPAAPTPGA